MSKSIPAIKEVDLKKIDQFYYRKQGVGCIILSHDHKIILQQRDKDCKTFPGCLATFGGAIEPGETPIQALVRELKEELGARVLTSEVIPFGAITEAATNHDILIYVYFWQDIHRTITGCYEGQIRYYGHPTAVLAHPKVMEDVKWHLNRCLQQHLIK